MFQIEEEQDEKGADKLLFNYLTLITKLSKYCGLLELSKPQDTLCRIWGKGLTHTTALSLTHTKKVHLNSFFQYVHRSH